MAEQQVQDEQIQEQTGDDEPRAEDVYDIDDSEDGDVDDYFGEDTQEAQSGQDDQDSDTEDAKTENEGDGTPDDDNDAQSGQEAEKTIPDELARQAQEIGLSEEDIGGFTPEQLQKVVGLMGKTAEKTDEAEAGQQKQSLTDDEFKIELDEDLYDPDICKAMKGAADQINALKAELREVSAGYRQTQVAEAERQFESMVNSLDDEYSEVLGRGSVEDIGTDSETFANRCKVMEEMNAIAAGYQSTGKKLPAPKQLFQRAVNSVFGDKIKASTRKSIARQLDKRSSQFLERSNTKAGKASASPTKRAESAVAQKLREFGAYDDDGDDDF